MTNRTDNTAPSIASLLPGQSVFTSFGPGVISAVNRIDSIVYVVMATGRRGLYLLRPEHITCATSCDAAGTDDTAG